MAIKCSKGFADMLAQTKSIDEIFTLGEIRVFSGAVPSTAEATVGASATLWTITDTTLTQGITFNTIVSGSRVLKKLATSTWGGTAADTAAATYFRLVGAATDNNGASDVLPRIQGTVGTVGSGADFIVASTTFAAGTKNLSDFSITIPE